MESENNLLIETYQVPPLEMKVRLSDIQAGTFKTIHSRKAFKNAIKQGLIKLNSCTAFTADYISGGEIIEIYKSNKPTTKPAIDLKIDVIYEDDYLAIVNKPAGMVVSGNKKWTLENSLSGNLKPSTQKDSLPCPEPIHRLDFPTSGALLIGKTAQSIIVLNKLFEEREIQKTYYAVTIGSIADHGQIETPIESKAAITEFKIIESIESPRFGYLNLTELKPQTGRRHQLRIHMASLGNPILGDTKYGQDGLVLKGKGLYLQSSSLKFKHPITDETIHAKIALPKKFKKLFPSDN